MGEYAHRKSDNAYIKIGTCEAMYYLRFDDIDKVRYSDGDLSDVNAGRSFRIPFPGEDHLMPGADDYEPFFSVRLQPYKDSDTGELVEFDAEGTDSHPGAVYLRHDSGLKLRLPCYHGLKLPEAEPGYEPEWFGKDPAFFEFVRVKLTPNGLLPLVQCRHCRKLFYSTWADVLPHIQDQQLRDRLTLYAIWRPGDALPDSRST